MREFPVQRRWVRLPNGRMGQEDAPDTIPWPVAEAAYVKYARRYGQSQSLERLADRGGFGAGELDGLLPDWRARLGR